MKRTGFTLIEVLVTLMLLAIVLPGIMKGITAANGAAMAARRHTEAASLAQSELAEIVASQQWQTTGPSAGDFGPDWPEYRWESFVAPWPLDTTDAGIQQIDLTVSWTQEGHPNSVRLSTLAYARTQL